MLMRKNAMVYDCDKEKWKHSGCEWVNGESSVKINRVKTPLFERVDQKFYKLSVYQRSVNDFAGPIIQTGFHGSNSWKG